MFECEHAFSFVCRSVCVDGFVRRYLLKTSSAKYQWHSRTEYEKFVRMTFWSKALTVFMDCIDRVSSDGVRQLQQAHGMNVTVSLSIDYRPVSFMSLEAQWHTYFHTCITVRK